MKLRVNRSGGWPVVHEEGTATHKVGVEFEAEPSEDIQKGIAQGYLVEVVPAPPEEKSKTADEKQIESPIVDDPPAEERPFTKEARASLKK